VVEQLAEQGDGGGFEQGLAHGGGGEGRSQGAGVVGQVIDAGGRIVQPAEDQGADEGGRGQEAVALAEGDVELVVEILGAVEKKVLEEGGQLL
jgi:hypothetical protein